MTRDDLSDFGTIRRTLGVRELRTMLDMCTANPYRHLFPMKPDIYTYPEHATERELLQYKIAVEQAALDGRPIEFCNPRVPGGPLYGVLCTSSNPPPFDWKDWHYRVARPKIAEGHNPAGVTEDQIPAGWRLFSKEEREVLGLKTLEDTRYWLGSRWSDSTFCCLLDSCYGTVITQKPAGFYLPQVKIAVGHNPDQLTEDQVGVRDGYRLLTADELEGPRRPDLEMWAPLGARWVDAVVDGLRHVRHFSDTTYRTKAAPGKYLPKPKPVQPSPSVQPTTVLGWLNMLPDGYRERALRNRLGYRDEWPALSVAEALCVAFCWREAPEGCSFWFDVHEALTKWLPFSPLPDAPKKLVPWSLGNFVWPDCVRRRGGGKVFGVQLATKDGLYIGVHDSTCIGKDHQPIDWEELAEDFEYSVDNGRTWQPCCRTEDAS